MVKCAEMPIPGSSADDLEIWAGELVDQYVACALRHNALVDHVNGK